MTSTAYENLSAVFGFPDSELFPRILANLMSEGEAGTMPALPGTPGALAEGSRGPWSRCRPSCTTSTCAA
jgi:hypothetical protein